MTSSVPTRLVFLSNLSAVPVGDKVRFLGCVEEYDIVTGILTLKHMYRSIDLSAKVTIEHVREGLPRSATDVGSWLNVAGYVQTITPNSISVQAIMLWEAGSLKLGDYERALQARSDAGTTTG